MEFIRLLMLLLQPFQQFTSFISGSSYPTLNKSLGIYSMMFDYLRDIEVYCGSLPVEHANTLATSDVVKVAILALGKKAHKKLMSYYRPGTDSMIFLGCATFLDPRIKGDLFLHWADEDRVSMEDSIRAEFMRMESSYRERERNELSASQNVSPVGSPNNAPLREVTGRNLWSAYRARERHNPTSSQGTSHVSFTHELEEYKNEPYVDEDEPDETVLRYWQEKSTRWRVLPKMARKYLAMPASSVPSEEVFSAGGRLVTSRRQKMDSKTFQLLMESRYFMTGMLLETPDGESPQIGVGDIVSEGSEIL
jgi:hypothetical protein